MEAAPNRGGRLIGLVYLLYFVTAIAGGVVLKQIVVPNDSEAAANGILANETTYQIGVSLGIAGTALYLGLVALFHELFRSVGPRASLTAAVFGLSGCSLQLVGALFQIAPLALLKEANLAKAIPAENLHLMAPLFLKMYSEVYTISLIMFGLFDFFIGWLIFRSNYVPRILGVLMMSAGVGWLVFLWPPLATRLSAFILPLGGGAELVLMLWLITIGANGQRQQGGAG